MTDLTKYTAPQLHQLKKDIDKEIKSRRKEDAKRAQSEMKEVAAKYGLSLEEIIGGKATTSAKSNATVKFRHPTDPKKTWSGRGRKPVWLREWEEAGKSVDDLRVN